MVLHTFGYGAGLLQVGIALHAVAGVDGRCPDDEVSPKKTKVRLIAAFTHAQQMLSAFLRFPEFAMLEIIHTHGTQRVLVVRVACERLLIGLHCVGIGLPSSGRPDHHEHYQQYKESSQHPQCDICPTKKQKECESSKSCPHTNAEYGRTSNHLQTSQKPEAHPSPTACTSGFQSGIGTITPANLACVPEASTTCDKVRRGPTVPHAVPAPRRAPRRGQRCCQPHGWSSADGR